MSANLAVRASYRQNLYLGASVNLHRLFPAERVAIRRWRSKKDRMHEVHAEYDGPGEYQAALQRRKVTLHSITLCDRVQVPAAYSARIFMPDVLCAMQWGHLSRVEYLR